MHKNLKIIILLSVFLIVVVFSCQNTNNNFNRKIDGLGIKSISYTNQTSSTSRGGSTASFVINDETVTATPNTDFDSFETGGDDNIFHYKKGYDASFTVAAVDSLGNDTGETIQVSALIQVGILFDSNTGTVVTSPTVSTVTPGPATVGNSYFSVSITDQALSEEFNVMGGTIFFQPSSEQATFSVNGSDINFEVNYQGEGDTFVTDLSTNITYEGKNTLNVRTNQ